MTTRDRLLTEGMRLFGERGYTATSIAEIEAAAGLSPGSGALYKHFPSKRALLTAGLDRLLASDTGVQLDASAISVGDDDAPTDGIPSAGALLDQLMAVTRAGLRRMDTDRDLSRLVFYGLQAFPDLLARFGDEEIGRVHQQSTALLTALAPATGSDSDSDSDSDSEDWAAIAVALQGATAHYWLMTDTFGSHPTGIDEDRFVHGLATLAAAALTRHRPSPEAPPSPTSPKTPAPQRKRTSEEQK